MATGIVGTLGSSASLTYTPTANAKVIVCGQTNNGSGTNYGSISVNGVPAAYPYVANGYGVQNSVSFQFYAGAGISVAIATSSGVTAIVSALEAT